MTSKTFVGARRRIILAFVTILALVGLVVAVPQSAEAAASYGGGLVVNATNQPVVGARVSLTSTTESYSYDFVTDAKGVAALPKGSVPSSFTYTVYIAPKTGSGLQPGYWDGQPSGKTQAITVSPGSPNIKAVLKSGKAASIAGTVTGSGSPAQAVANVDITAYPSAGSKIASATTNAAGKYTITGLPADSFTL